MKNQNKYRVRISAAEIAAAKRVTVAELLERRGEQVKKQGKYWKWAKHDSCVIEENRWYQNSTKRYGDTIDFLQHFFDMSFPEAVECINGGRRDFGAEAFAPMPRFKKKAFDPLLFKLPDAADDSRRLYAYLTVTRHISPMVVSEFLEQKLIYQDVKGNIVFTCFDENGMPAAAHLRSTSTEHRFRGFVKNGDFSCGFRYGSKNADTLFVFEAPIDLMSFITLNIHEPWTSYSYLSLGGLSDMALKRYLKSNPNTKRIIFCFDNDEHSKENHGQATAKRFAGHYGKDYSVFINTPSLKDFNEVLIAKETATVQRPVGLRSKRLNRKTGAWRRKLHRPYINFTAHREKSQWAKLKKIRHRRKRAGPDPHEVSGP